MFRRIKRRILFGTNSIENCGALWIYAGIFSDGSVSFGGLVGADEIVAGVPEGDRHGLTQDRAAIPDGEGGV